MNPDGQGGISPKDPDKTYALMEIVDGTSFRVERGPDDSVLSWPHLLLRELLLFLLVFVVIVGVSLVFDAPLEEPANPLHPPNPAKAPWYFVGVQEWVSYSAVFGGILVPMLALGVLLFLPYLDRDPRGVGVWFSRERRLANMAFAVFLLVVILSTLVGEFCRGPNWELYWPWQEWPQIPTFRPETVLIGSPRLDAGHGFYALLNAFRGAIPSFAYVVAVLT